MASVLTTVGLAKLATASPLDPLEITHVAFGDGVNPLDPSSTSLVNEVYRSVASDPIKTDAEPRILIFEGSIPGSVGGFTLREMALFDVDGDMIAIGQIDNIIKPVPASGSQIILTQRLHVKLDNASDVDLIAQDVAVFDHQGLSNRSATDAHPATSISTEALSSIGQGASTVQAVLATLKSAALRAVGTGSTDIPDTTQLNARLGTTGNLGTAAQRDIGTATSNVPDKAVLDSRFGEGNNVMVGAVVFFASTTTPSGYIKANGAAVSRTTYANLFTMLGTTFGAGNGSTTFNVPDLRGEFIRGFDDGRGIDSGRVFGSSQTDELESHTHRLLGSLAGSASVNPLAGNFIAGDDDVAGAAYTNVGISSQQLVESTGGVETRPRNIALIAYIKF